MVPRFKLLVLEMSIKRMKFYHVNLRSLFGKLNQLDLLYSEVDVICCSETWLDNRFTDNLVNLPGKSIYLDVIGKIILHAITLGLQQVVFVY